MSKKRQKRPPLLYFFYKGDLHRKVHISRPTDIIIAWNYPKGKAEKYIYSQVRREGKRAFTTAQVQQMIGRKRTAIKDAVRYGHIQKPQMTYGIDDKRNEFAWKWSEENIMELHEYFTTVHVGRPRKDGLITPAASLPTARELRSMIRQGTVFYVQTEDGEFVPTWDADNF